MPRLDKVRTLVGLGAVNVARVAAYRVGLKTGLHPALRIEADVPAGPFFGPSHIEAPAGAEARQSWLDRTLHFGWSQFPIDGIPDWHANPFKPTARADASKHWSELPDFDPDIGDIKSVWEASRFDWLLAMAQRAVLGEIKDLARLNSWLEDWICKNPPYLGANWKCGQEASIRVLHLATAAIVLGQVKQPTAALVDLVRLHLQRIAPTMGYAVGQQNNHGTSEAAALYVGGSWLEAIDDVQGRRWRETGARWLEDRAEALIEPDGTFSQYSVNYHRLFLDTYCIAEVWRRRLRLPGFSRELQAKLKVATLWLRNMTDHRTGEAPNIGANDGARIAALTDTDYWDFRPSVQLAAALFLQSRAYVQGGLWDQPKTWLGIEGPATWLPEPESQSLNCGGFHVLRLGGSVAYLRFPRFRFRPSQADALHLDFWLDGRNILRDAGTFSYGLDEAVKYFSGTSGHNTVEIDGRDQMPRLGRFLFGSWLRPRDVSFSAGNDEIVAAAGYRDAWGGEHKREVRLSKSQLICTDVLGGTARRGVLRWRLDSRHWTQAKNLVTDGTIRLAVSASTELSRAELRKGWESRYYLQKRELPVYEVEVNSPAIVTTEISF